MKGKGEGGVMKKDKQREGNSMKCKGEIREDRRVNQGKETKRKS